MATGTLAVSAGLPPPDGTVGCHSSPEAVVIGGLLPVTVSI
jgi:hypothetical protein